MLLKPEQLHLVGDTGWCRPRDFNLTRIARLWSTLRTDNNAMHAFADGIGEFFAPVIEDLGVSDWKADSMWGLYLVHNAEEDDAAVCLIMRSNISLRRIIALSTSEAYFSAFVLKNA